MAWSNASRKWLSGRLINHRRPLTGWNQYIVRIPGAPTWTDDRLRFQLTFQDPMGIDRIARNPGAKNRYRKKRYRPDFLLPERSQSSEIESKPYRKPRKLPPELPLLGIATLIIGGFVMAREPEFDPITLVETLDTGYYPTNEELPTFPHNYDGAGNQDMTYPTGSGGYLYTTPDEPRGLNRLRENRAIDRAASFFEDHDSLAWETSQIQRGSFVVDGDWPFFNRRHNPGTSLVKAGPFLLDLVYAGAGFIYSDYSGDRGFGDGEEDGATAIIELGLRGQLRLGDDLYLTGQAALAYLPFKNRLGFNAGSGFGGSPNLHLGFNYERELGSWDVRFYDSFRGGFGFLDLFLGEGEDAFDRAGRYSFGISARESRDFSNDDDVTFSNNVGFSAGTLFLSDDYYLNFNLNHYDFWQGFGFDDHRRRDNGEVEMAYRGSTLPFSPSAFYEISSSDGFDNHFQRLGLRVKGRLTDYVTYRGEVGYLWGHGERVTRDESLFWTGTIYHRLTERTSHSLYFGENIVYDDFTGDEAFSRYLGYRIQHRLSSRCFVSGGAQWSEDEPLQGGGRETTRSLYFAQADYRLWTHSRIFARAAYERSDTQIVRDQGRWIGRLGYDHMLAPQVSLLSYYQYENASGTKDENFDEHAVGVTLRKYF
jgi:hypothetical protein